MLSVGLFLVLALTSASTQQININIGSDIVLNLMNRMVKGSNDTITKIPAGSLQYENSKITYSEGTLVGLDSMVRTGDCFLIRNGSALSFDIHFGYSLLTAFFGNVKYQGKYMSAFFRIGDNSLRLTFTVHTGHNCHVSLDAINYEKMSKVTLGTSEKQFDGLNVDAFFQKYVMPEMDRILSVDTASVEDSLQVLCKIIPGSKLFGF